VNDFEAVVVATKFCRRAYFLYSFGGLREHVSLIISAAAKSYSYANLWFKTAWNSLFSAIIQNGALSVFLVP